jgi:hypothetical protein
VINRRTRLLARVLFGRLFENDLFSPSTSASAGVTWLVAALATPGVMFSGSQYYYYAHSRTFAPAAQDRILFVSQAFHVGFAMAVAGLVTMLVWTSLTPDRRDALVLGPLPLRPGEQARARLLALLRFFAMFATAVAVPTAVAFTFVTVGSNVGEVPGRVAGHIASTMMGAGFVFFTLLDVQLVLAATLGSRAVALATLPLQAAAIVAMVGALSFTAQLSDAILDVGVTANPLIMWNPVAWFVGVYRWCSGETRDVFATLAFRGVVASSLTIAIAMITLPLAYERCLQHVIANEGHRTSRWSGSGLRIWVRALTLFLRTPLERGLATFIVATFARGNAHRFLIGSYIGVGMLCAVPLAARLIGPADTTSVQYAWFSIPLGLLCWTAAALRVAMMLPTEATSNWIFKLTEPVDKRRVLSTAVTVMQGTTAFPLAVVFGVASMVMGGIALGATVFAVVAATGVALIELLTLTLRTVPCTCTYRPGQLRLRVLWPIYLTVWLLVAYRLPVHAVRAVGDINQTALLIGVLLSVGGALRVWRLARSRRLRAFVYEEVETPWNLGALEP